MLKILNDHLGTIAGILTSLLVVLPQGRKLIGWVVGLLTQGKKRDAQRAELAAKLDRITEVLTANGVRLEKIESEMKFNGGKTVKDMLFLLFQYRRHDYWRLGVPALEMDGDGQVTLVSEAACRLFGVVNPDDLKRRSWLRFIEPGTVDDLLHAFKESAAYQSEFQATIRIRTPDGMSRGEWEMRAAPISQEGAATKIYSAHLSPADEVAHAASTQINWSFFACKNCVRITGKPPKHHGQDHSETRPEATA